MSERILVTGAAGFIGFHTIKGLLNNGYDVIGIDNINDYYDISLKRARLEQLKKYDNCFSFYKISIEDKGAMEDLWGRYGGFKKVIHLAAQAGVRYSLENPYAYVMSNCLGHLTILEMCRHTNDFEHLVYASSSSVYGGNDKIPFSVKDRVDNPVSLYAATKKSDELMSSSYAHLYKLPQTGLRFFTVYGEWGRPDMAYYIFTKAIIEGKELPVFNHGKMARDFTYINDIVDGILSALEKRPENNDMPHRIFNLGNNKSEKLMDFINVIEDAVGKKANLKMMDMQKGDVKRTYADIDNSIKILGYNPKTTINEGIPKFVKWYKSYGNN